MAASDIVSLHLPLTADTEGLIDRAALEREYALTVNPSTQILARRTVKPLDPGQTLTLTADIFNETGLAGSREAFAQAFTALAKEG